MFCRFAFKNGKKYLSFPSVMSNTTRCCDHKNGGNNVWGWKRGASSLIVSLCHIIQVAAWSSCRPRKRPTRADVVKGHQQVTAQPWVHQLLFQKVILFYWQAVPTMQASRFWKILRVPRGEYQNIQHLFITSSIGGISFLNFTCTWPKFATPLLF